MENEYRITIGKKLESIRLEKGISLRSLAETTGYNYSNIRRVELGKYNTGIDIVGRIANALGCDLAIIKRK